MREMNFRVPSEVRPFVEGALSASPARVKHVLEIAKRVRESAARVSMRGMHSKIDLDLAECAALLHDIGYWPPIAHTGFHPIDGARFLEQEGEQEIPRIIVGHSCSPEEGELRGFPGICSDPGLIAKLITYWDVQVQQGGAVVSYDERLQDILARYGTESIVGQANLKAKPRIETLLMEVKQVLGE